MNALGTFSQYCSCFDTGIGNASVSAINGNQVTACMPKKCHNLMQKPVNPSKLAS